MSSASPQIVIHGAGIAGLWTFHRLKKLGYDAILLEKDAIGGGQTLASQGIIHSGLKYAIAGQVNDLAKQISLMPDLWRGALKGQGDVDLSSAKTEPQSQYMMIPSGFMGGITKVISQKILGDSVRDIAPDQWPEHIKTSGFKGTLVHMNEPVLDITQIIRALAAPYKDSIRKSSEDLNAALHIYTAAADNHTIARISGHDQNLETQARPLLMGFLKPAPFHLNAHLIAASDKPVATITTHTDKDGTLVWYLGGAVAEREKDSDPQEVISATKKALKKYLPTIDQTALQWATLPIDRIEGKSGTKGWMPDTPTMHAADNALYCWPTKLTFAPMLSDMVLKEIKARGITPTNKTSDVSHLPEVDYALAPWDKVTWTSDT